MDFAMKIDKLEALGLSLGTRDGPLHETSLI